MRNTMPQILEVLDDGLSLYRREFARMAMIAALITLPAIVLAIALFRSPAMIDSLGGIALFYGSMFLSMPLSLYVMGALSRATMANLEGRTIQLREVLAIGPLRIVGMGCYGLVFLTLINIVISLISMICLCPFFFVLGFMTAGSVGSFQGGSMINAALAGLMGSVVVVSIIIAYTLILMVSGASYSCLIFSLQPFVQGTGRLGEAIQRSIDMSGYRLLANLRFYLSASLVFGTLALSVTLAIGTLVPFPLLFLIGYESPLAQGLSAAAIIAGMTLVLPPLPIWMTMLYQRRMNERDGGDLAERIAAFAGSGVFGYPEGQRSDQTAPPAFGTERESL
ncbi:MAG: hypothetical protein HGA65_09730 [Oscillochloris sp.]|nr:hypothetical protein [Oscillochloris sp.]